MSEFQSIGCFDYGNNNFFEVMKCEETGRVMFLSHEEDEDADESVMITYEELIAEIAERDDFAELKVELDELIS